MYDNLTYQEVLDACQKFYPEMCFGKEVDWLERVEEKLVSLARCDDLTKDEKWKVGTLLPNVKECLT